MRYCVNERGVSQNLAWVCVPCSFTPVVLSFICTTTLLISFLFHENFLEIKYKFQFKKKTAPLSPHPESAPAIGGESVILYKIGTCTHY